VLLQQPADADGLAHVEPVVRLPASVPLTAGRVRPLAEAR
jgi:hypothetical protein